MKTLHIMVAAMAGFAAGVALYMTDPIARAIIFAGMFIGVGLIAIAMQKKS